MKKKQNVVDLTDMALGIVILGITVAIGARLLLTYRDNRLTDLATFTTANETVTGSNTTAVSLDNAWFNTVSSVTNTTGGETVGSGNFSVTTNAEGQGQFLVVGSQYNGESLNVTYTSYNTTNPQWNLPNDAATGLAEYGNWFDIIVIIGVAGLILSLIFLAFGNRGESGNSVAY